MFYDFGLGGVGQYNAPGLTPAPAPAPTPRELAPFPLPPSLARPPAPMQVINPYEAAQTRLLSEQQGLVNQTNKLTPPQINYAPPMNPLAAALIAFGSGTLAHGGEGLTSLGAGGKAGLETYIGLKNADQKGTNEASQANYANKVNQLKTIMGGLEVLGKGYGELSKDQAERAKAAALVGADVYGNQIKQDYYAAQNAMEAGRTPYLNDLAEAQAGMYRFNADPNNPSNKTAQLALKNQLARDKFEGEYGQRLNTAIANAGSLSDRQLELTARELFQISQAAKAAASSFDPKENSQYVFNEILTTLRLARDEAQGVTESTPGLEPGKKDKTKSSGNPVSQYLTLP